MNIKIDQLLNKILLIIIALFDLVIGFVLITAYFICAFIYFRVFKKSKPNINSRNALFLPSSGSIDDVIKKFGGLEVLNEHNPNNFFSKIYMCFFPSKKYIKMEFSDSLVIYDFRLIKSFKSLSFFSYFYGLVKITRQNQICLIRAFSPYIAGLAGRLVSWIFNIPFCVSVHADDDKRYELLKKSGERVIFKSRFLAKLIEKFVYKTSDMILPIRDSLAGLAIKSGSKANKIFIIPHGVDLEPFNLVEDGKELRKRIDPDSKFLITSICRHSLDNYVLEIIEAIRLLSNKRRDFKVVMAGDGVLHEKIKKEIRAQGLTELIMTTGFIPRQEAIKYWLASDIAICLMGGFSLIEAALAGKPIISYDVEWHYELVVKNKTGFLIKEHDTQAVADSLNILMSNPKLIREYGQNARQIAQQRHAQEVADKIKIDCYKKLLASTHF